MKKILFVLLACLVPTFLFASSVLIEGFEYANHDMTTPIGWTCDDDSWLCGYLEKDHNRRPHSGNWYAFTNADDAWMFMEVFAGSTLKYRYSFWGISDGEFEVELWIGNGASANQMTQRLFTTTVSSGEYELFSEYIQSITANCQYFGIHAIASEGAYHLTIDDVTVDMVNRYEFTTNPSNTSTTLYPGEQTFFRFDVHNLGYEPIDVILIPSSIYFTDVHFTVENITCTTFHLEPDEIKQVFTEATLLPTVAPGSYCYLDVMLRLECDCASSMATLWATVMNPEGIAEPEHMLDDVQQVEVYDLTGKKVDPSNLKAGIYLERTITDNGVSTRKIVKK